MQRAFIFAWDPTTGSRQESSTALESHPTSTTYFKLSCSLHPQEEPHLADPIGAFGKPSDHKSLAGLCKAGEINWIQRLGKGRGISAPAAGVKGGETVSNALFSMGFFLGIEVCFHFLYLTAGTPASSQSFASRGEASFVKQDSPRTQKTFS